MKRMMPMKPMKPMKHPARVSQAGISMIEILIALVIISILGAIAYPSYKDRVYSGRRAEAKTALSDLATRLESYYAKTNTYATATIGTGAATDVLSTGTTSQGFYTLTIDPLNTTATAYRIVAAPVGVQAGDTKCGSLSLTSANVKGIGTGATGTVATCW